MEEKSKTERLKLREINQTTSSCQTVSGGGTGPNDCMTEEYFDALCESGALSTPVYVCGLGWTAPTTTVYGSGSGSGSGSGFVFGSGFGGGSGGGFEWGSGLWGSGSGSGSGVTGGGSSGGDPSHGEDEPVSKAPIELMDKTKFVGWDGTNCLDLCKKTLQNYGIKNYGSSDNVFRLTYTKDDKLVNFGDNPIQNYKNAIECIDKHLNAKRVIIVGVDYDPKSSPNLDGTDHFVVITGRGYDDSIKQYYYTFMDNATSNPNDGCSNSNRLYFKNDLELSGNTKIDNVHYDVTQVRPNDGGKYDTTSISK